MSISQEGSNVVIKSSVAGSVFPVSEKELAFPVLVDGSSNDILIEGSLYGRSVEIRGKVSILGPIVVRGDVKIVPSGKRVTLRSGITVNGSLNCVLDLKNDVKSVSENIENASIIIKGDIAVNQNVSLKNAIVFGSIHAVNCTLENSLVLGTCIVSESLTVKNSSIGGYVSRDIFFEGYCMMLHALGESTSCPVFLPYENLDGTIIDSDIRYYPAIRAHSSLINRVSSIKSDQPNYSKLFANTDWVEARLNKSDSYGEALEVCKWVLSIGGRIGDISKIENTINNLAKMLKCGFEFEHYHANSKVEILKKALEGLTTEEQWILKLVCE